MLLIISTTCHADPTLPLLMPVVPYVLHFYALEEACFNHLHSLLQRAAAKLRLGDKLDATC